MGKRAPKDEPTGQAGETVKRREGETEIGGNGNRGKITDSPIPRFPGSKRRGFSLVELMVVVTIMAVLIATSLIFGNNFLNSTAVKNATRDIASVMRMAHSKAGALKTSYVVVFDLDNNCVWVQTAASYPPKNPLFGSERKLSSRVEIDSVNESYDGGKGGYQEATGGTGIGYLPFRWDGTSVSGSVKLQDIRGNNQYSITVMYTTSRAHIKSGW